MHDVCSNPCGCDAIPEQCKALGHLRTSTSDDTVLPCDRLPRSGAKYIPTQVPEALDAGTREGVHQQMADGVKAFTDKAGVRSGNARCMHAYASVGGYSLTKGQTAA